MIFNPIRNAAYAHLVLLTGLFIFSFLFGAITYESSGLNLYQTVYMIVALLLTTLVYYGFFVLGKSLKNNYLKRLAVVGIVWAVVSFLLFVLSQFIGAPLKEIAYIVCGSIFGIFWGIGLLKIRSKVKYAKTAGILDLIYASVSIIFVLPGILGFLFQQTYSLLASLNTLVIMVANVFEILLLFHASKAIRLGKKNDKA